MELEQQNKPRRRGRPPKNRMENLIISNSEDVEDDMDLMGVNIAEQQESVETTQLEQVIEYKQPEIDTEQLEVDTAVKEYVTVPSNNQDYNLDIPRLSKLIGKSEDYILLYLADKAIEQPNLLDTVLDLLEQSCIKPHKYSVGEYVWIPEEIVDRTTGGYGKIEVVYLRKPRKVKISKVIYTTKICYGFEGFKKLQVLEQYCFETEEECQKVCDNLNANR